MNQSTTVLLDGVSDAVTVWRLASGRLVVSVPYDSGTARWLRSLSPRRARLATADADVATERVLGVLPDGRVVVWQQVEDDRAAAAEQGDFVWTVAANRADQLAEVLTARYPVDGAAAVVAAWSALPNVTATPTGDGRVAVHSPWAPDLPDAMRATGGRWNKNDRVWVLPGSSAAAHLANRFRHSFDIKPRPALPPGSRRNKFAGSCGNCGTVVEASGGRIARCDGAHETADDRYEPDCRGWCDSERWHTTCPACAWRALYRLGPDEDWAAWAALALSTERVRLLRAAGIAPSEDAARTANDDELSALAAFLNPQFAASN